MLTFHDMFCGAGGSTDGAIHAGAVPVLGMNHWPTACDSYRANHAIHAEGDRDIAACVDVVTQDPRRYPKADILIASPECTYQGYARGKAKDDPSLFDPNGDMAAERSRATMWDVVRFAEWHEYRAIIVENVEGAVKWGLPKGRKLKHGTYGPLFAAWLNALEALDYRWQLVHLNSKVAGVPQSRDRLYVVMWKKGQRAPNLEISALAWCPACDQLVNAVQTFRRAGATMGTHGSSYDYTCPRCTAVCALAIRPCVHVVDWSIPAQRIGDRKRPVKPATRMRIRRGLERLRDRPYAMHIPGGLVVQVAANTYERQRADGSHYSRSWGLDQTMPTITQTNDRAVVIPTTHHDTSQRARPINVDALPTVTAANRGELGLVYVGNENAVPRTATDEPLPSITAIPGMYAIDASGAIMVNNVNNNVPRLAGQEAMHTLTTGEHAAIVTVRGTADRPGGTNTPTLPGMDPLDTVSAQGYHHGLVVSNYGSADGKDPSKQGHQRHLDTDVLGTVTAKDSHALLSLRDGVDMRRIGAEPMTALTTHAQHALVGDVTEDEIDACTFRMLQAHELKAGSGFRDDYILHGTKTDQVMQIGNAVTPPAEALLMQRVIESLS